MLSKWVIRVPKYSFTLKIIEIGENKLLGTMSSYHPASFQHSYLLYSYQGEISSDAKSTWYDQSDSHLSGTSLLKHCGHLLVPHRIH